jgi:hypothetical protein
MRQVAWLLMAALTLSGCVHKSLIHIRSFDWEGTETRCAKCSTLGSCMPLTTQLAALKTTVAVQIALSDNPKCSIIRRFEQLGPPRSS